MLFPSIICGGIGSRLWPLSRPDRPKQFLDLFGNQTLLATSLSRIEHMASCGEQIAMPTVICNASHTGLALAELQLGGYSDGTIIGEPSGRNTAAAAALAAHHALSVSDRALVLLLPADHHIGRPELLAKEVSAALKPALEGRLVTFGICPDRPETGYGYIESGAAFGSGFEIARFVEKPDRETAISLLAKGGYHWNSGIFLFEARWFLQELEQHRPDMAQLASQSWHNRQQTGQIIQPEQKSWNNIAGESIDIAIAENTKSGMVIPVDMEWSDIGSWASVHLLSPRDAADNAVHGQARLVDSSNCHVHSQNKRNVTLIGVSDLVVIDTPDALLVMDLGSAQKLGKLTP